MRMSDGSRKYTPAQEESRGHWRGCPFFHCVFQASPQPAGWCCPHSEQAFPTRSTDRHAGCLWKHPRDTPRLFASLDPGKLGARAEHHRGRAAPKRTSDCLGPELVLVQLGQGLEFPGPPVLSTAGQLILLPKYSLQKGPV